MIATRRTRHNFGLQRAVEHAVQLGKPLVVLAERDGIFAWLMRGLLDTYLQAVAHPAGA